MEHVWEKENPRWEKCTTCGIYREFDKHHNEYHHFEKDHIGWYMIYDHYSCDEMIIKDILE